MFLITFPIYTYGIYKMINLPIEHNEFYNAFIYMNLFIITLGVIHFIQILYGKARSTKNR